MNEREISLVSEWNTFVNNENFSFIEKCLKLAQILEYPELSISKELEKIKEIGMNFRNRITESKNPTYVISLLNEFLFDAEEFEGDLDDYYNPKNNFLFLVIGANMSLRINDVIPDLTVETDRGVFSLHEWIDASWAILFSHPKDFTPVCTTELGACHSLNDEFGMLTPDLTTSDDITKPQPLNLYGLTTLTSSSSTLSFILFISSIDNCDLA